VPYARPRGRAGGFRLRESVYRPGEVTYESSQTGSPRAPGGGAGRRGGVRGTSPGPFLASLRDAEHEPERVHPGFLNNGVWVNTGGHGIDPCIVGDFIGTTFRDYFTFDASLLGGCARSARLQIPRGVESGEIPVGANAVTALVLHDVSTDALTLNTSSAATPTVFADLGGAVFGSRFFPTAPPFVSDSLVVYLNGAGVQALNAAFLAGGFFSIGGMIANESAADTFLFAITPVIGPAGKRPANLIVTTGPC